MSSGAQMEMVMAALVNAINRQGQYTWEQNMQLLAFEDNKMESLSVEDKVPATT
jgi:hypothetical protein